MRDLVQERRAAILKAIEKLPDYSDRYKTFRSQSFSPQRPRLLAMPIWGLNSSRYQEPGAPPLCRLVYVIPSRGTMCPCCKTKKLIQSNWGLSADYPGMELWVCGNGGHCSSFDYYLPVTVGATINVEEYAKINRTIKNRLNKRPPV